MADVDITIAGRSYRLGCRAGEEDKLKSAARMVDARSRQAIEGLGTLSEARQLLFAALLLADQLIDGQPPPAETQPAEARPPDPALADSQLADPQLAEGIARLAERLEALAERLESGGKAH